MIFNKIVILVNKSARSSKVNDLELKLACEHINKFKPCQIIYTESITDFINKISEYSSDLCTLLAVAGGDGTLNIALNNLKKETPIGLIPIGTANVVAKELGFPNKIRDNFKLLLTGAIQKIDIGIINQKKFAFVAGIGFDAFVANSVSKSLKKILGQAAYAIAIFKCLINYKPTKLTINCEDGRTLTGDFAIFANMRRYGGNLFFAPEARYDDGLLNLILLKDFSFLSFLKLIKYAYGKGNLPNNVIKVLGSHFKVIASAPTYFQLDGEVFGPETSFDIGVESLSQGIITV